MNTKQIDELVDLINNLYDEYEGALKFILSKWMEAEWEEV